MNAAQRKGPDYEIQVAKFLSEWFGVDVDRTPSHGNKDQGDIKFRDWAIECKNQRAMKLSEWMNQTEIERQNAHKRWGVLLIKRKMKGVAQSYAVMPLAQLAEVMSLLEEPDRKAM